MVCLRRRRGGGGNIALLLFGLLMLQALPSAAADSARSFRMGFTPFKYSWIEESQQRTYALIADHADLIVHHLDGGVPWVEAFEGRPFADEVEANLADRVKNVRPGQKVFVSATPIDFDRKRLAGYWGAKENMARPGAWKDKGFDDPDVVTAYLNYCRGLIRRFAPDYFAYGIEVNLLAYNDPVGYAAFVSLARRIYPVLKQEFPRTRILLSFYLEPPTRIVEAKKHIDALLPFTDLFAISTYPYMVREGPPQRLDQVATDWFEQVRRIAPGKPFAIAETGFIAEPLSVLWKTVEGTPADQEKYAAWMLSEANRLDAEFVVWFVVADYDELWSVLRWIVLFNPLMKAWKDTGMFDGELDARPALGVWDAWLRAPIDPRRNP